MYTKENPKFITNPKELDNLEHVDYFSFNCIKCGNLAVKQINSKNKLVTHRKMLCTYCLTHVDHYTKDNPKTIITISDFDNLHKGDVIKYNCKQCGEEYTVIYRSSRRKSYENMLCLKCFRHNFRLAHPEIVVKSMETIRRNHNGLHNMQTEEGRKRSSEFNKRHPEILEKAREANRANHGGVLHTQTEEFKEYMRDLCKQHPEWQTKSLETNRENHGGVLASQTQEWKDSVAESNIEKYGEPYPYSYGSTTYSKMMIERYGENWQTKIGFGSEKFNKNMSDKYGENWKETYMSQSMVEKNCEKHSDEYYIKTKYLDGTEEYQLVLKKNIFKPIRNFNKEYVEPYSKSYNDLIMSIMHQSYPESCGSKKIIYFNIRFDSIAEFCVYIFCFYNGIPIIRNYKGFPYKDIKGKDRHAHPDFIIVGQYVEVKGAHFFKPDGTMWLPYREPEWDDERYEYESSIYESKRQCLIKNNVIILKDTDPWVQMCVNWVKAFFGNYFIWQYTKNTFENVSYGYNPFNCDQNKVYQEPIGLGKTPFDLI